ncbi:hypothetical protein NKI38_00260 [Mesorhizobium sp. M0621]|uniref:hypothetical protein n=1 Tax=Mesorhizobium sp. M0621 TaxID=2956974 RepID=UPI0033398335
MLPEGVGSFFRSRWQGLVPLDRLFWRDLVLVGTALNVASAVAAIILLALKLPLVLVLAVHFALVPYNIFLTFAVWRTTEKASGTKASLTMLGATLWLILTVVA